MIDELTTVADLEVCGLTPRVIALLDRLEFIYITDLRRLTEAFLLRQDGVDKRTVEIIRNALINYKLGKRVKTVAACIEIQRC